MNEQAAPPVSNPFRASRLRPGGAPYLWPAGLSAAALCARLAAAQWRGQIIGPHGSGKSALLAALLGPLQSSGRPLVHVELHDGQRRLPRAPRWEGPPPLFVVDGYEQLGWRSRWDLRRAVRRGAGLLLTAHGDQGWPTLWQIVPCAATAAAVAQRLAEEAAFPLDAADLARRYAAHGGNLRELLFELYDEFEIARSLAPNAASGRAV